MNYEFDYSLIMGLFSLFSCFCVVSRVHRERVLYLFCVQYWQLLKILYAVKFINKVRSLIVIYNSMIMVH